MNMDYKQIALNNTRVLVSVIKYQMRDAGPGATFFIEREKDVLQIQVTTSAQAARGHDKYAVRVIPDDSPVYNDIVFSSDDLNLAINHFLTEINKGLEIDSFINEL